MQIKKLLFEKSANIIEVMITIKNLVEYYDELFPTSETRKKFFSDFSEVFNTPVHFLSIDCGTGLLESILAKKGHDVTGIENTELLVSANLRRRSQLMSIRFFQMEKEDMSKFLGKSFYNVISVLNSRIIFMTRDEIKRFFSDCKKLISENGSIILELINFEKLKDQSMIQLPVRESVRSKLFTEIYEAEDGTRTLTSNVENSSGKILPVLKNVPIYPLMPSEIEQFAEEAGFSSAEFYADFEKSEFTGKEERFIVVIK